MDYKEIARIISESKKKTYSTYYINGKLDPAPFKEKGIKIIGYGELWLIFGDYDEIKDLLEQQKENIYDHHIVVSARSSALPLADLTKFNARIEHGAIVRDGAYIGNNVVVMMGAVINIGAEVGDETMVDMNAVIGARAIVGKRCHIGAGAVIAGVLEPPSATPVIIEDDVLIGANAVVLEGVRIGKGSVVAAGAVVIEDVPEGVVVAGIPARVIKKTEEMKDKTKISILKELRKR